MPTPKLASNNEPVAGEQVGAYRVDKTIGQGTYGKVKLGFHIVTGEKVAIKVIQKSTIENDRQIKRIQKEVRFLKLLHHPNIVRVYDVLETATEIFIVMEYASGGELFDYIVAHKRVKDREARHFFRQIVSALDYCHSNSVIHRDLKPENLLLDENKNIKIIDFGFSNTFQSNELLNTFCGSPFYAAPEMILGKRYEGPEVDIWSLGVILFALLCGHLPFDDDDVKELYKKISSATYATPTHLSDEVKQLISRMICVHPKKRATLEEIKMHRWVNEGYTSLPNSFLPKREPLKDDTIDEEIVQKVVSFGYPPEGIIDKLKSTDRNVARETYYLLKEMYEREELDFLSTATVLKNSQISFSKSKQTSRPDISLNSISEDNEWDSPMEDTAPTSASTTTPQGQESFNRIIDDFGRRPSQTVLAALEPRTRRLSSPGTMITPVSHSMTSIAPAASVSRTASTASSQSTVSSANTQNNTSTTSLQSQQQLQQMQSARPSVKAEPLFPNKGSTQRRATAAAGTLSPVKEMVESPSPPTSEGSPSPSASTVPFPVLQSTAVPPVPTTPTTSSPVDAKSSQRRMSLSAVEYAAKKSALRAEQKQVEIRTMSGWFSVSTTSSKPVPAIFEEVRRVLQECNLIFEFDGGFCFLAEESKESGTPVCLEIELCKVARMTLMGLHFKRIRGNIWAYKRLCNKIISLLTL